MTETTTPTDAPFDFNTPPDGPRDHWTSIGAGDGTYRWYRHTWPIEAARAGLLDAFLATPGVPDHWSSSDMRVVDDQGDEVAVVVSSARLEKLEEAARQLERAKDQPDTDNTHPALHGPHTGGDNLLLDTEDIRKTLAWAIACVTLRAFDGDAKDRGVVRADILAESERIEREQSTALIGASVQIATKVQLWPDTRGAVPVRAWSAGNDSPEQEEHWSLAYTTPARGLYVKAGKPNLWGEDFNVVTGSGYSLRNGFMDRPTAEAFAVAVAEAVPGIDWRVWDAPLSAMPPEIAEALMAVFKAWGAFGKLGQPVSAEA